MQVVPLRRSIKLSRSRKHVQRLEHACMKEDVRQTPAGRDDFRCCENDEHDYSNISAVDTRGYRAIKGHALVWYIIVTCHFRAIAMRVLEVESSALGR